MVRVEHHCGLNIALNALLLILIWSTLSSNIFSFNSYKVTLGSIFHKITYEDFPADVEISFSKFEKSACLRTSNPDVLTLCSNILSLESSGLIYKLGCFLTILSIFVSVFNMSTLLLQRKTVLAKLENSHFVTPALYWVFVLTYFILSGAESMVSPTDEVVAVTFEKGSFYMFCAGGLALCILAHFLLLKSFSDYEDLKQNCVDIQMVQLLDPRSDGKLDQFIIESKNKENDNLKNILAQQEQDLKEKERLIAQLQQRINEFERDSENGSVKIAAKKKANLRSGQNAKHESIESVKEELGRLRNQYATEKHQWEEEIARLKEKDASEYYVGLVNELCAKIEELRGQLSDKEVAEEEKNKLGKTLKEIKGEMEVFKSQSNKEKKDREAEVRNMQQVIENLELELAKKNKMLAQQANIDALQRENETMSEELVKTQQAKRSLSEKVGEMAEFIARLEKDLIVAQENKHNLDLAQSDIAHLRNDIQNKKGELDKLGNMNKVLKEALSEKENRIEEFEGIMKMNENKIKKLTEGAEDLKQEIREKEENWLKDKDELKERVRQRDDDVQMLTAQLADLEKELSLAKKAAHAEKSEEYANLKEEAEMLENKISTLNSHLKKHRDHASKLELELENSLESKTDLEKRLGQAKEQIEQQKNIIDDLTSKLRDHEELQKNHSRALGLIETLQNQIESLKAEIQQLKDLLRTLEVAKKEKEYYEKQYQNSLKDIEAVNARARKIELENVLLSNLQNENSSLHDQLGQLANSLNQAKSQITELQNKYNSRENDFEREKEDLLYDLSKSKREITQLEKHQKNQEDYLTNEIESVQRDKEALEDLLKNLNSQNDVYKKEIDRLDNLQKFYKNQSEMKTKEIEALSEGQNLAHDFGQERRVFEGQIDQIKKNLDEANRNLKKVTEEKDSIRKELAAVNNELKQISEENAGLQNQIFQDKRASAVQDYNEHLILSPLSNRSASSSARSTQDLVIIESMVPPYSNALLDNVSKLKKEPPMTYKNVWKLFEDIMTDKCKMDRLELAMGRQPRTMTEYMLDFVYLQYGLKTLALRQLKSLIASLEVLYKQGHPYGTLFCRFLGLFHPRPLSFQISIYLLIIQEKFMECSAKVKEKKPSNFSQAYEIMQYGGQASIIDLLDLVQKICRNNREVGERIITNMHKDRADRVELSILKICGVMARMGKTSDFIFEILNAERRGHGLEYQEFIDGIRYTLNIWVTQYEAEDLCSYIDHEETGYITFDAWYQKVNFVEFAEKMYSKAAMITKSDFLNALVDEYEREIVEDYRILKSLIKYPVVNHNAFATFLLQIDPNLDEEVILRFYDEAREQDHGNLAGVSPHSVCVVVLKHNIGGYGVGMFDVYDLDQEQPKTSTEGVRTELVVERNTSGRLEIDLRRRNK